MMNLKLIGFAIIFLSIVNEVKLLKLFENEEVDDKKGRAPVLLFNYKKEYKIKESEQVKMKCPIDMILSQNNYLNDDYDYNNNLIIINWFDNNNNKIISYLNNKRFIIENDIYLIIKNVNLNDAGLYKCDANNGFGTVSVNLTLNVIENINKDEMKQIKLNENNKQTTFSTEITSTTTTTVIKTSITGVPVFLDKVLNETKTLYKLKGDELKLKCNIKKTTVKTDIEWYKNGKILNEEDYGITRSKWVFNLKNLRIDDTGNYTCQVFNKYGFINATYEVYVYDETEVFEGIDPINSTVEIGKDTTFTCKVKSDLISSIQWLRQISKKEYDDYMSEQQQHQQMQIAQHDNPKIENKLNTFLNSFFIQSSYDEGLDKKKSIEYIDGTHYITIKDEKQNQEKLLINNTIYLNKLTIKNITIKDNGVYICFAITSNGYTYRKAYLNVINTIPASFETRTFLFFNGYSIKLQNLLIILIPLITISLFSIISIIYLKFIQTQINKKQNNNHSDDINDKNFSKIQFCVKLILKLFKRKCSNRDIGCSIKNYYLPVVQTDVTSSSSSLLTPPPLPTSKPPSTERHLNEYIHPKQNESQNDDSQARLITSLSSASTSTYLLPKSIEQQNKTISSAETTISGSFAPSIVYYKVLDCSTLFNDTHMINEKNKNTKKKFYNENQSVKKHQQIKENLISDTKTTISTATTNSRFYYQLNSDIDIK